MTAEGKKIGVVLAGCGYLDGAEIQEATLTLLALDRLGVEVIAMAPNKAQAHVVDHQKAEPVENSSRNVFDESARITRGNLKELGSVSADDLDALILPGGFGAAKNLSDFAFNGTDMSVDDNLEKLIRDMRAAEKPMGFICIAPAIAAKVLGDVAPQLTIGNDPDTAAALKSMGAEHKDCPVDEIVVDERLKVVSTPAYMLGPSIAPVAKGIDKLVAKVISYL
ncbi:MAG: isoprenoid biosynthesis glyoxalase ElbB [Deltaproteobacteria bacterium]|jgi:enhancing lycopene biosynthesis protein 2|nr:isoprenoid biosynthesis glyoxalase ElbB [Deltaproteobacteria bacterium]MBT6436114.1 isoprenoid biosynthesis glyoxalase ElbB [Deltaproteobacteria bacterium]